MATDKSRTVDLSNMDIICRNIATTATVPGQGTPFKWFSGNGQAPTSSTATSLTVTAAILLAGIVINNSAGLTATLDTAANLVAGVNAASAGVNVGDIISCEFSANTGTTTIAAGTGGTFDTNVTAGAKTIAIAGAKTIFVRFTNVTPGSEAYVIYM